MYFNKSLNIPAHSEAAGKSSGITSLKILVAILCMSSVLQGAILDDPKEELEEPLQDATTSNEVASIDISILKQPQINVEKIQLPTPTFEPRSHKSSFLAVGLSVLAPGLGHFYLNDMKTGTALIGITGMGIGAVSLIPSLDAKEASLLTIQNIWSYGIYAAYRDVRAYNGESNYSYRMPNDSLSDLTSAPFSLSILKKPEVWGGVLAKFALVASIAYWGFPRETQGHSSRLLKRSLEPLIAFPVGVGEEALFRGYLQSQLSEIFNPWVGIALTSLAFGAMHISNAQDLTQEDRRSYYTFSVPFITLGGFYYGWLAYKNRSLRECVALHTWYDFILLGISSLAGDVLFRKNARISFAMPF